MNPKNANRCKVGELRPSQVLTTFGIGSIVDLPNLSVMVMGLEDWPLKDTVEIGEQRLLASVKEVHGEQVRDRHHRRADDAEGMLDAVHLQDLDEGLFGGHAHGKSP